MGLMATSSAAPVVSRTRSATMSGNAAKVGTLLVKGPHRKGIVTSLTQILNDHGTTVVDSHHYSDQDSRIFYQRLVFDASAAGMDRVSMERHLRHIGEHYGMTWRVWYGDRTKRIAIMASKQEHC